MAADPPGTLRLPPFPEPQDPDYPESPLFVAGFKDEEGERWGAVVPLKRELLDRLVLLSNTFQPRIEFDGMVQVWPDDVGDDLFEEMLASGMLPKAALDDLVAETLELHANEADRGEEGVLAEYAVLRDRLKHALDLVETEIAKRTARSPEVSVLGAACVLRLGPWAIRA
jgi:hypothetical protein